MTKTVFVHIHKTENVGDKNCSPQQYFPFPASQTYGFGDELPTSDTAIYGGGQVFRATAKSIIARGQQARNKVVWGIGISTHQAGTDLFKKMAKQSQHISSRNKDVPGCDWVPCVSAMSNLFDTACSPTHDAVLFFHAEKSKNLVRVNGMPAMSNHGATMAEAIRFIGSGHTVISNSFHGVYWALCLGRKVLCVPFSEKFLGFAANPVLAGPDDWPDSIENAEKREGVLEVARHQNQLFFAKCRDAGLY
jgi:hypothetical protein